MLSYVRLCGFMKSEAPSIMDFLCWKLLVNFEKAETQVPARRSHEAVSVSAHCRVRVAGGAWQGPGCMIESVVSGQAVHWPGRLFRCQSRCPKESLRPPQLCGHNLSPPGRGTAIT